MFSPIKSLGRRLILLRKVKDFEARVREQAVRELGEIAETKDIEVFAAALRDDAVPVRKAAAEALANLQDPAAEKALTDALNDPNLRGPWQADILLALQKMRAPSAMSTCITSITSRDVKVRRAAAAALGNLVSEGAADALARALGDDDNEVVREAMAGLTRIGEPAVPMLICILEREEGKAKQGAAEALGLIGDARAVEPLIAALKDKDSFMQIAVAKALSRFDDPRVVAPLIEALEESATAAFFYGVREEAEMSLVKIGKRAIEPLIEALRNPQNRGRQFIVKVLGEVSDPRTCEALAEAAQDADPQLRKAAIKSLMACNRDYGLTVALGALDDPSVFVRHAAADALSAAGWRPSTPTDQARNFTAKGRYQQALDTAMAETYPILAAHLQDADPGTRREVAVTLSRLRDPQFLELLRNGALVDPDRDVQRAFVDAMQAHGNDSLESLIFLLEQGQWFLRRLVSRALTALQWTPDTPEHLVLFGLALNDPKVLAIAADTAPELLADALTAADEPEVAPTPAPSPADTVAPLRMRPN